MKYRSDFVTNSSSSSFIIDRDKFDGELTVEGVFQKIKELHGEFAQKRSDIDRFLSEKYGITIRANEFYKDGKIIDCKWRYNTLYPEIEQEFDVDPYWLYEQGDVGYYKTYAEYAADGHDDGNGFCIVDYRDERIELDYADCQVLSYYMSDADFGCFPHQKNPDCANCSEFEWCEAIPLIAARRKEYGDDTMQVREIMRRELLKLGEICIKSADGQIDFNIVRQLKKRCTYSSNHMG